MSENFLHYLWKFKKFETGHLTTSNKRTIEVLKVGQHNHNSGPDFFNAKIRIDDQLWVGNVEIHVKSSDWLLHQHDKDQAYDSVILHVVWKHDTEIRRTNNSIIPTLSLGEFASKTAIKNYKQLFYKKKNWINCEKQFKHIDIFLLQRWLERLYFERFERKALEMERILEKSKHNWEEVFFRVIFKNFGLKLNADAFDTIARSIPFTVLRKCQSNQFSLEAIFMGQAGFLEDHKKDGYYTDLKKEYQFLSKKFNLKNDHVIRPHMFRLRPSNFPTIRLSQLAQLYSSEPNLFSRVISMHEMTDFYALFSVNTSPYWESHFTFNKKSNHSIKQLTHAFINLIVINSIIPIRFLYAKYQSKFDKHDLINIINALPKEKNTIVEGFENLRRMDLSALESQALIQLKANYCDNNKCLDCEIGQQLISSK
ncbi:MAG: DUF2851 family protein [Bacteroidia bacterium]|nr:DUF2851 family protein [Bacteroidia bacterium]NNK60300.1 DUF2851 family protein [Flavobacteriaceae bacterium]NNL32419.1 DUF2851 family protein [Flavobacteriaceae bacterium]